MVCTEYFSPFGMSAAQTSQYRVPFFTTTLAPLRPNGARDKVHPSFGRDSAFLSLPKGRGGAKRSRASDVSFIEQMGGARTEPNRNFSGWSSSALAVSFLQRRLARRW